MSTRAPHEHFDVLIVGAGLSGVGAARHLQRNLPEKTFVLFEARGAIGGTWDLFRYPGIRSDSDMYTLGYSFRPWEQARAIADGPSILEYVRTTAQETGIEERVRFGHRVTRAEWSSESARWTVTASVGSDGDVVRVTCAFLFMCSGYYAAIIALISGDVLGLAAANGWTEAGWGIAAAILLVNTLLPRRRRVVTVAEPAGRTRLGERRAVADAPVSDRAAVDAPADRAAVDAPAYDGDRTAAHGLRGDAEATPTETGTSRLRR